MADWPEPADLAHYVYGDPTAADEWVQGANTAAVEWVQDHAVYAEVSEALRIAALEIGKAWLKARPATGGLVDAGGWGQVYEPRTIPAVQRALTGHRRAPFGAP